MSETAGLSSIVAQPSCARCKFMTIEQNEPVCRRHPPQVTIVMMPAPAPRVGQLMPASLASFPNVRPEFWCGEFVLAPAKLT